MSEPDIKNAKGSSEELEEEATTPIPKEEDTEPAKMTYKEIAMKNGMTYTVTDVPPLLTSMILGLQHYLTMLGATVLIPLLLCPAMGANGLQTAEVISSIFFVSGINTVRLALRSTRIALTAPRHTNVPVLSLSAAPSNYGRGPLAYCARGVLLVPSPCLPNYLQR